MTDAPYGSFTGFGEPDRVPFEELNGGSIFWSKPDTGDDLEDKRRGFGRMARNLREHGWNPKDYLAERRKRLLDTFGDDPDAPEHFTLNPY